MDMNEKMIDNITNFYNNVGDYIHMEYDSKYHEMFFTDSDIDNLFDMVANYYMGGNNVPDTAGMIVDYFRMIK
jgi:hypothetical protein